MSAHERSANVNNNDWLSNNENNSSNGDNSLNFNLPFIKIPSVKYFPNNIDLFYSGDTNSLYKRFKYIISQYPEYIYDSCTDNNFNHTITNENRFGNNDWIEDDNNDIPNYSGNKRCELNILTVTPGGGIKQITLGNVILTKLTIRNSSKIEEFKNELFTFKDDNKPFTALKIIIKSESDPIAHANILFINWSENKIFIFEPYGDLTRTQRVVLNLFERLGLKVLYHGAWCPLSVQKDDVATNRVYKSKNWKEPVGFCVSWSLWMLNALFYTYTKNKITVEDFCSQRHMDIIVKSLNTVNKGLLIRWFAFILLLNTDHKQLLKNVKDTAEKEFLLTKRKNASTNNNGNNLHVGGKSKSNKSKIIKSSKESKPKIHIGKRGGKYYIKKGKKIYV